MITVDFVASEAPTTPHENGLAAFLEMRLRSAYRVLPSLAVASPINHPINIVVA